MTLFFIIPFLLVLGGGYILTSVAEDENTSPQDLIFNGEIYTYPDNQLSENLNGQLNGQIASSDQMTDDEENQILINTETKAITANYELDSTEEIYLQSIITQVESGVVIGSLSPLDQQKLVDAQVTYTIETTTADADSSNNDTLYVLNFISTITIYMILIFGIQLIATEIFEEKSSRAMEIIITNTKPQTHMLVKMLSNTLLIVTMFLMMIFGSVLGLIGLSFLKPDSIGKFRVLVLEMLQQGNIVINPEFIISALLIIAIGVITIITFELLASTLAAMTHTYEDFQKANTPLVLIIVIPYMISLMNIAPVSKILAFFPLFTTFFAPGLYLSGDVSLLILGLYLIIQIVFLGLLYWLAVPIYREGLLNYSTSSQFEIIKRGLKNRNNF